MPTDALEQARFQLTSAMKTPLFHNDPNEATHYAILAGSAALIAIAEELRGLKTILCNATTLGGAIKLNSDDDLEQISNHLDDVGSVLLNARGPDGAFKVTQ